jgi:hypothetical protein
MLLIRTAARRSALVALVALAGCDSNDSPTLLVALTPVEAETARGVILGGSAEDCDVAVSPLVDSASGRFDPAVRCGTFGYHTFRVVGPAYVQIESESDAPNEATVLFRIADGYLDRVAGTNGEGAERAVLRARLEPEIYVFAIAGYDNSARPVPGDYTVSVEVEALETGE